jgi:hypothetical protein
MTALMVVLRVVMRDDWVTKGFAQNRWRDVCGVKRILAICSAA